MSSAICFNLDQSKILSSGHGLVFSTVLKTYTCTIILATSNLLSPGAWNMDKFKTFLCGEELTLSQMTNFTLSQIQGVCG